MKTQKGITLVALVITIIVMLILVGVTITLATNGGLFSKARDARNNTANAAEKEKELANGKIDGVDINNIVDGTVPDGQ